MKLKRKAKMVRVELGDCPICRNRASVLIDKKRLELGMQRTKIQCLCCGHVGVLGTAA